MPFLSPSQQHQSTEGWKLLVSRLLWNIVSLELFVISVSCKSESSSPVKAATKRKHRDKHLLTNCDGVKHRRWSAGEATEEVTVTDVSVDRSVEYCAQDSWTDTETKAAELRRLLEHERKQSDDFEAYLSRALSGSDCQTPSPSDRSRALTRESTLNNSDRQCSLTEKISQLQSSLMSEREANRLFELQLLQICLYDWVTLWLLYTGWPLSWKTWKCQGILQLSENWS